MQGGGFEPPRLAAIGPQPIVSASFTIPARQTDRWVVVRVRRRPVFTFRVPRCTFNDRAAVVLNPVTAPAEADETSCAYLAITP